jgi:hypothetical protein
MHDTMCDVDPHLVGECRIHAAGAVHEHSSGLEQVMVELWVARVLADTLQCLFPKFKVLFHRSIDI